MAFDMRSVIAPPFVPNPAPAFAQADLAKERGDLIAGNALERALAIRELETRTLPDIRNDQAARGATFSGATRRKLGRAGEDTQTQLSRDEFELEKALGDIERNQFLATIGIRL